MAHSRKVVQGSRVADPPESGRRQVTLSVSEMNAERMDRLAMATGLSRSRIHDLAVLKFLRWAKDLDPYQIRLISLHEEPSLGYRRSSSMRAAVRGEYDPPAKK